MVRRKKARLRLVRKDRLGVSVPQAGGLLSVVAMLVPAAAVVAVGVALMVVLDLRPEAGRDRATASAPVAAEDPAVAFPEYVLAASPRTQEAYRFALERPEALQYIPCYCGCGAHSGHKSVHDCFLRQVGPDIVEFEEHGASCDMCVNIVLDVKEQLAQGKSLGEIRSYIDAEYARFGPGTDTPLPPE